MAVIRNIDSKSYAVDASGTPVTDAAKLHADPKEINKHVARFYPIDKYEIPAELSTSARVGRLRILKVPLLGQAGYKGNWCGRTSMSMAFNWFQLLTESDPKDKYITHWNGGQSGSLMNLRLPSGIRAFTHPEETAPIFTPDHGYGGFAEYTNKVLKKKYGTWDDAKRAFVTHELDTYVAADAVQRAARLGKLGEEGVQNLFEVVVRAVERNNPVFMYSGLTKGRNHLILLCGFAFITEGSDEKLWIAVADPATEDWISSYPSDGKIVRNTLDLTKAGASLDSLNSTHNVINLVDGDWNARRATMSLVRASFFLKQKGELGAFAQYKGDDFSQYSAAHALVMDDVGNPHPGGAIFYSHDLEHQKTPEGAVLVREPRCVFPIDVPGIPAYAIPALHRVEARAPSEGGAYPLGSFQNLHGGVHFPTSGAATGAVVPVRAIAPGTIVAARVHNAVPESLVESKLTEKEAKELEEKAGLARELSANSPDFVLIRHELEIPADAKESKEAKEKKKTLIFYCLYMHLQRPEWGKEGELGSSPWATVPWLSALMRERMGTITVVDPDPTAGCAEGASRFKRVDPADPAKAEPIKPMVGDHFWPAEKCKDDKHQGKTFSIYDPETSKTLSLVIDPAPDGRFTVVTKAPEGEIAKALDALSKGELVSFPEAHRNLVVDAGTIVGFVDPSSKRGPGFMHWEILSPADGESGIKKLIELAGKHQLDIFKSFEEAEGSKNNKLDADEDLDLCALLPEDDRKDARQLHDLRKLSFATSADATSLPPDHYHLRVDVRNFEKVLKPGSRQLRLIFHKPSPAVDPKASAQTKSEESQSETTTLLVDVAGGETTKWVAVPGWASKVEVQSTGVMARAYDKKIEPKEVDEHLRRITGHRWRNVAMRHVNEWSEDDMLRILKARFKMSGELEKIVRSLCWWGDAATPLYSSKALFGEVLPKSTALDNVHPIVAVWILNLLLERRHAYFKNPKSEARRVKEAKAMFAGWLPRRDSAAHAVGEDVSVVVVSNCPYDADLRIKVVASGPDKAKPVLGAGQYRGDTYVAGVPLSGWGKFEIAITHQPTDGPESKAQPMYPLGELTVELPVPVLAPHNGGPTMSDGMGTWDIYFSGTRPKLLLGYLVAEARVRAPEGQAAAPWKPCKVALPIRAVPVELDQGAAEFEGGFLVRGPTGKTAGKTKLAAGIEWRELEAAKNPQEALEISQVLLGKLGELDTKYATATGSDLQIVKGSLAGKGTAISVMATGTKPPKGEKVGKTAAQNNLKLRDLAAEVGLTAVAMPEGAAAPHHVVVSIAHSKATGKGGVMRVTFDPKPLYGAVLAETKPGPDDVVEVTLGCDFFNGGHLLGQEPSREPDGESGEMSPAGAIEGVDLEGYRTEGHWLPVRSGRVDALAAMPRIENVGLTLGAFGLQLTAELVGGDAAFWKAAAPVFKIGSHTEGSVAMSGTGRNARGTLRASVVTAKAEGAEAKGVVTIQALTTRPASFGNVELAAGKVKWQPGASPNASYDTTPAIEKVAIEVRMQGKRKMLLVTATTRGIPAPLDLEVAIRPAGGDESEESATAKRVKVTFVTSSAVKGVKPYLAAGPDGRAMAQIDATGLKSGEWDVFVRRPKSPKVEPTIALGAESSAAWTAS